MVHDHTDVIDGPASLDQIAVRFDEQRLVSDAGAAVDRVAGRAVGLHIADSGARAPEMSPWVLPLAVGAMERSSCVADPFSWRQTEAQTRPAPVVPEFLIDTTCRLETGLSPMLATPSVVLIDSRFQPQPLANPVPAMSLREALLR